MGAAVQGVDLTEGGASVRYKLRKDDSEASLAAEVVLVATGRKPYTGGLGLEALGVEMGAARHDQDRRAFRHLGPRHLCHRRRDRRADAGPQGRG